MIVTRGGAKPPLLPVEEAAGAGVVEPVEDEAAGAVVVEPVEEEAAAATILISPVIFEWIVQW